MAARNKPAGIRSLVYGIGKGKVCIEGLSVSGVSLSVGQVRLGRLDQAERERLLSRFLTIADRQRLVDPHRLVADGGDREAQFGG
jgi:hypothetical protein